MLDRNVLGHDWDVILLSMTLEEAIDESLILLLLMQFGQALIKFLPERKINLAANAVFLREFR